MPVGVGRPGGDRRLRVVAQVGADSAQVAGDRHPDPAQVAGRADAGAEQQVRRTDRAGGQHDLVAVHGPHLPLARAPTPQGDAGRAAALDQQPVHQAVRQDGQVGPAADRVQVAHGGAPADAAEAVERQRAAPGRVRRVVVRARVVAGIATGVEERLLLRAQLLRREPAHRNRSVAAVVRVAEVVIGLDAAQAGQHLVEAPARAAQLRPAVVVLRHATQEDQRVHRARTADDPAARHEHVRLVAGGARPVAPAEPRLVPVGQRPGVAVAAVAVTDLVRQVPVREVRTGLDQQQPAPVVPAQTGGQDRPGRAGPDDDGVEVGFAHPAGARSSSVKWNAFSTGCGPPVLMVRRSALE